MTYKFEQFNLEITDPIIQIVKVNDSIYSRACSVDIKLTTDTAEFGVNLDGFTYDQTWEDADIHSWVESELQKHTI